MTETPKAQPPGDDEPDKPKTIGHYACFIAYGDDRYWRNPTFWDDIARAAVVRFLEIAKEQGWELKHDAAPAPDLGELLAEGKP
jgi:hypothetical protein